MRKKTMIAAGLAGLIALLSPKYANAQVDRQTGEQIVHQAVVDVLGNALFNHEGDFFGNRWRFTSYSNDSLATITLPFTDIGVDYMADSTATPENSADIKEQFDGMLLFFTYINMPSAPDSATLYQATVDSLNAILTTTGVPDTPLPTWFRLAQNTPNPFNPNTSIKYSLDKPALVRIDVYDATGRLVKNLIESELSPGTYQVNWDGTNNQGQPVSSGVYLYRMIANGKATKPKKMILIK
ncbi:T9SS C-terminal target domain-containing protein [Candidatus Woesearchaeota archaeon]|nr:MAG: T9SS C-terminal target domain-containing protein [Candidatus Woesearchaeota archaeon]